MYECGGDLSKLTNNQVVYKNVAEAAVAVVTSGSSAANTQDVLLQLQCQLHFQQV